MTPTMTEPEKKSRGVAVGAFVLGIVVLGLGLVLQNQANFSRNYLKGQLAEHGITFTPVANLCPSNRRSRVLSPTPASRS